MAFSADTIIQFFSAYAYEPTIVYLAIIFFMLASSFGLPFPEEVTLLSAGLVSYMAMHPELYPPPTPEAIPVNPYITAFIAFGAVFLSDLLVFTIGRIFGARMQRWPWFRRRVLAKSSGAVERWTSRYGAWTCGIFRFTPGLRFPGHLACGMLRIPTWKFIAVDGTAALLTVPTQVLLMAFYGEMVLSYIKQFKIGLLTLGGAALVAYLVLKLRRRLLSRKAETGIGEPFNGSCADTGDRASNKDRLSR